MSRVPASKARRRVIANLIKGVQPQRGGPVQEACIAAESPHVTGIQLQPSQGETE